MPQGLPALYLCSTQYKLNINLNHSRSMFGVLNVLNFRNSPFLHANKFVIASNVVVIDLMLSNIYEHWTEI